MQYNTITDIDTLAGKQEDDEFDIKKEIITTADLTRIILSFANGDKPTGHIIIGLDETRGNADESQNHKVDVSTKYPIKFPVKIKTNKADKDKNAFSCDTFEKYVDHLKKYIKNNIFAIPEINIDELLEIKKISISANEAEGCLIVININQHSSRPIQFISDHKFYKRYPETVSGKGDACSKDMDAKELFDETKKKYYRNTNQAPVYYQARPAVPELTALFDFIYYGDFNNAKKLLEEIPTLTQMADSTGNNALHVAAIYGKEDVVNLLIDEYKMSIFQTNSDGRNVLLQAVYGGKNELAKKLILKDSGLLRQRDRLGDDAYLIASQYNNVELNKYFIEYHKNAFLNTRNNSGWNVLQVAVYSPALESFNSLMSIDWNEEDLRKALDIANIYKTGCERPDAEQFLRERIPAYTTIIEKLTSSISELQIQPTQPPAPQEGEELQLQAVQEQHYQNNQQLAPPPANQNNQQPTQSSSL